MSDEHRVDPKRFWSEESRKKTIEAKLADHLVQVAGDMLMPSDDIEKACEDFYCSRILKGGADLESLTAFVREQVEKYRTALEKISAIRDSIVGMQGFNFSEHAYPLVAALEEAGFKGSDYWTAKKNLGTLIEQRDAAEARIAALEADVQSWKKALEDECQKNHEAGGHGAELRTQVRLLEAAAGEAPPKPLVQDARGRGQLHVLRQSVRRDRRAARPRQNQGDAVTHKERVERWQRMLLDPRFDGGPQAIIDAFSDEILEVRNEALDEAIEVVDGVYGSACSDFLRSLKDKP